MPNSPHKLYNAESGEPPLPTDKREIEAVICATQRCYEAHPYFIERYGVRGEAFARSDGGYLTTLVSNPMSYVHAQVNWLAEVLSCRGMPRWLMESHLDLLCEELSKAVPARVARHHKLTRAAQSLRYARQLKINQADFDELSADFEAEAGSRLSNAGGLLVAAVCDEACGISLAVPSLIIWLADPERFSTKWCDSVTETLKRARTLAYQSR
jgi:hypothetical protein